MFTAPEKVPDYSIFAEDVVLEVVQLPEIKIRDKANYIGVLNGMRWSVQTVCDEAHMEIISLTPPMNSEIHMRWRLKLWPKDPFASLQEFLDAPKDGWRTHRVNVEGRDPYIVEGYSKYQFDPWRGRIVRHRIDFTNPPMFTQEVLRTQEQMSWVGVAVGSRPAGI